MNVKPSNLALYYKGSANQLAALYMLDRLCENLPEFGEDQEWVKKWRSQVTDRHINTAGLKLIKDSEELRLIPYQDSVGIWTVGWGHTKNVKPTENISVEKAVEYLDLDLSEFETGVDHLLEISVNENQFSALVSFAFNCGLHALAQSTLLKFVNQGDFNLAANEFERWNKAGFQVLEGLSIRRLKEKSLFLS
jgi:GH24 family phage-related lysozyme (muramidase)